MNADLDNLSNRKGHETETKKSNVSSDLLKVGLLVTTSICCTDNLYHFVHDFRGQLQYLCLP
jgi:hypothetical protein